MLISVWLTILWSFLFIYLRELKYDYLVLNIYIYVYICIWSFKMSTLLWKEFQTTYFSIMFKLLWRTTSKVKMNKICKPTWTVKVQNWVVRSWIDHERVKASPDSGTDFPVRCVPADSTDSLGNRAAVPSVRGRCRLVCCCCDEWWMCWTSQIIKVNTRHMRLFACAPAFPLLILCWFSCRSASRCWAGSRRRLRGQRGLRQPQLAPVLRVCSPGLSQQPRCEDGSWFPLLSHNFLLFSPVSYC